MLNFVSSVRFFFYSLQFILTEKNNYVLELISILVEMAPNSLGPQQLAEISLGNVIRSGSEWNDVFVETGNVAADSNLPER